MSKCTSCGECCFIMTGKKKGDKFIMKACKFLERKGDKYHCKVYKSRLGRIVGRVGSRTIRCVMYNSMEAEIKGCPLNEGVKPVFKVDIKGDVAEAYWV